VEGVNLYSYVNFNVVYYDTKQSTVEPRYTEVSGEASLIRYNEIFGIVRYLYITKLGLRSSNIRYNETYVNNIFILQTIIHEYNKTVILIGNK